MPGTRLLATTRRADIPALASWVQAIWKRNPGEQIQIVARSVADAAMAAYDALKWDANPTLASAEEDKWADPKGEFLAGKLAEPVYALFGKKGTGVTDWPSVDQPVGEFIGYHVRTGKHDVTAYDWEQYLNFADRHFPRGK